MNVLGQRSGHNLYLIDGATVTDELFNNMVVAPSIDSIERIQHSENFLRARVRRQVRRGDQCGHQIAESNQLHGSLFEFVRNDIFDAKNFFDSQTAPIPPFRQNQFGGSLGGPLIKNRTFFFVDYEGQRIEKSLTSTFSVPTDAMRTGDFAGLPTIYDPEQFCLGHAPTVPWKRNSRHRTGFGVVGSAGQHPACRICRASRRTSSPRRPSTSTAINASARLDHQISDEGHHLRRDSLFDAREFDPFGSGVLQESLLPGFGRNLSTHSVERRGSWTHVFSAEFLNEARFGISNRGRRPDQPKRGNPFAAQTGLQGVTTNPLDMGFPQVSFGGQFTTMGDPALFTFRDNHDFEFFDNVSLHWRAHTHQIRAYLMHYELQPVNPNGARGIFSFTPRLTSSAPGWPTATPSPIFCWAIPPPRRSGLGRAAMDGERQLGAFLHAGRLADALRNLKLDFGLRYEYNQNMTDAGNQIAAIDTVGTRRPVRHRERRRRHDLAGRERAAAVSSDSLRDIRRGGLE